MAQAILINKATQAVDPDHIAFLDFEKNEIRVDGHTMRLSDEDMKAIVQAKTGGK